MSVISRSMFQLPFKSLPRRVEAFIVAKWGLNITTYDFGMRCSTSVWYFWPHEPRNTMFLPIASTLVCAGVNIWRYYNVLRKWKVVIPHWIIPRIRRSHVAPIPWTIITRWSTLSGSPGWQQHINYMDAGNVFLPFAWKTNKWTYHQWILHS